ncbi:MAG: hypothetical protein JSS79_06295 [Bacteroidetes bacterium]|nr:hypothetical protein [Bacteroidota bacterium]
MNARRIIFLSVFVAYQLFAFLFTLAIEYKDGFIYTLLNKVTLFKYGTLLGLVLAIIEFVWVKNESKDKQ